VPPCISGGALPGSGATIARSAAGAPVCLTGTFDRAAEHLTGNERKDDRMLPDGGVLPVFRDQVEQPLDFPDD
jgi:hypothetical protein